MSTEAKWKVGDRVFDMPSQADCTVLAITNDGEFDLYQVDARDDPTGDGAFPDGWRNSREIGPAGVPMKLEY